MQPMELGRPSRPAGIATANGKSNRRKPRSEDTQNEKEMN
jgi:hypothetical protein